jgi:hypothetical protein
MGFAGVGGVYSGVTAYSQRKRWTSSLLRPPNGWTKQGCCSPVAIMGEKVSCWLLEVRFLVLKRKKQIFNNRSYKNEQLTTSIPSYEYIMTIYV